MHSETIIAADGQGIAASFFGTKEVSGEELNGAVLIVSAMGVARSYYAPFATWLASEGFTVATFDYRGTGGSRQGSLRGLRTDIVDWAELDCAAMIEALERRAPGKPIYWVGHSLGGQILGFVPNRDKLAKAITVATGSGYWRENTPSIRPLAWYLWHLLVPAVVALCGYFPGKKLRKIGDLPKEVMLQWRRWCLHPDYAVGDGDAVRARFAAVRTPIVSLSFQDDEMMSARNTESMHGFYVNAPRTMKRIAPGEIGARRIGHFGFFRAAFEDSLWRAYLLPELRELA
jgi:predicted alpha/beta hydrolase